MVLNIRMKNVNMSGNRVISSFFIFLTIIAVYIIGSNQLIEPTYIFLFSVCFVFYCLAIKKRIDFSILFFVSMTVFVLGRGILGSLGWHEVFSVVWGQYYDIENNGFVNEILLFWSYTILILCLALTTFSPKRESQERTHIFSETKNAQFYYFAFSVLFYVSIIMVPFSSYAKIITFFSSGYSSLYSGQTEYNFSFMRVITFIIPVMFAITLILDDKKIMNKFLIVLVMYLLASLVVGQRGGFGSWVLVYVWYMVCFKKKKNALLIMLSLGAICLPLFQFIENYRSGLNNNGSIIFSFFNNQGMTFFMPFFYLLSDVPPIHTILASVLPLGGVMQTLGISSPETSTLSTMISFNLSPSHFEQGYGVGSSGFVELFALSGNNLFIYFVLLFSLFSFIQLLNKRSAYSERSFFIFCQVLPYLFLFPRGSLNQLTSQIVYSSIILLAIYLLYKILLLNKMK